MLARCAPLHYKRNYLHPQRRPTDPKSAPHIHVCESGLIFNVCMYIRRPPVSVIRLKADWVKQIRQPGGFWGGPISEPHINGYDAGHKVMLDYPLGLHVFGSPLGITYMGKSIHSIQSSQSIPTGLHIYMHTGIYT